MSRFGTRTRLTGAGCDARVGQWLQRSLIRSIQRGSITINNGFLIGTATITSVVPERARLIYLGESHGAPEPNSSRRRSRIALTNATTITATRDGNTGTETVLFEICEFWPGVMRSVQRGTVGNTTAAITAVTPAKSTIDQLGWSTSATDGDCGASVTLTDATTVTGVAQGSSTTSGYQVIEWN